MACYVMLQNTSIFYVFKVDGNVVKIVVVKSLQR